MATSNWDFAFAGTDFPPTDESGFSPTFEPVDKADRNAKGDMVIEEITFKRTITANWSRINGEDMRNITRTCRDNRVGSLRFYDISYGSMTSMKAYYAPITTPKLIRFDNDLKKQRWSLSIKFVEM